MSMHFYCYSNTKFINLGLYKYKPSIHGFSKDGGYKNHNYKNKYFIVVLFLYFVLSMVKYNKRKYTFRLRNKLVRF